jgi:hypothetical protein
MAAMTLDPGSRGVFNIPANVIPNLSGASPPNFPVGQTVKSVIKCNNVAFGSTFQIGGVDSAAATWVSPFTICLNYTAGATGPVECQVITPDGLLSNKIRIIGV